MRLGALLGPIPDAGNPRALADQARRLEAEGYASLWSAHAVGRGFMLTDPFVALSVAASVTERVEIGTAVAQLPLYAPADLAHRAVSLAQVAGGRLSLGVGAGSTAADFEALGRDHATRHRAFAAGVRSLRALLAGERVDGVWLSPWPAVAGGIPLLLGSWGAGVERAAAEFDGWIASAMHRSADEVIAALARYRSAGGKRAIVSTIQLRSKTDLGALRADLARYAAAGFDDAVVMFLPGGPDAAAVRMLV